MLWEFQPEQAAIMEGFYDALFKLVKKGEIKDGEKEAKDLTIHFMPYSEIEKNFH